MRSSKRSSIISTVHNRSSSTRHGRVTKDDIRSASLRRWDGRARVTTEWVNLYQEPELCFSTGDLLIYLREPGQSSHGPAFRVHKAHLKAKGFDFLLDRCISRPPLHPGTSCSEASCHGCDKHPPPSELYVPAPSNADLDDTFDHHITTRNFFAWLYNLPLAGRALGRSLVILKERIDYYRPGNPAKTSSDIVAYAETQRYLDFRECVDHALAALLLAECLQIKDLWVDAFVHCVGMSHRGLNSSLEYWAISYQSRVLINEAQFELERRIESVRRSVCEFFERDLSSNTLGLSQAAREHFNYFRSWLHTYYIEQHGFWPPTGLDNPDIEHCVYTSMYADFRSLYHHLVDSAISLGTSELRAPSSGGICVTQNVQAFDAEHRYENLPNIIPILPNEPDTESHKRPGMQRRTSWNPLTRRKLDKDKRKVLRIQSLINASNRDWAIMECPLVRKYSEFESQTVIDDAEHVSMVEGRKVRWIVVYAILQTFVSVMESPKQVRNSEGLAYHLCCRPPALMPWEHGVQLNQAPPPHDRQSVIEPDTLYTHSNISPNEQVIRPTLSLKQLKQKRRQSMPVRTTSSASRPSSSHSLSTIKRFVTRRESVEVPMVPKSPGFCEILVHGYGNGLNEIETSLVAADEPKEASVDSNGIEGFKAHRPTAILTKINTTMSKTEPNSASTDKMPDLTPTSSTSVSRESSNASTNSSWNKPSLSQSNVDYALGTSPLKPQMSQLDMSNLMIGESSVATSELRPPSTCLNHVLDEDGLMRTVHFNTQTWDNLLDDLDYYCDNEYA